MCIDMHFCAKKNDANVFRNKLLSRIVYVELYFICNRIIVYFLKKRIVGLFFRDWHWRSAWDRKINTVTVVESTQFVQLVRGNGFSWFHFLVWSAYLCRLCEGTRLDVARSCMFPDVSWCCRVQYVSKTTSVHTFGN